MLALIAGQGALPKAVAEAQAKPPLIWAVQGFAPDGLTADGTFQIETLGTAMADLAARGVTTLCLCGHIRRPQVDPAAIDSATAPLVPRLMQALTMGDDGALRVVITLFEEAGFSVLAAHQAAPGLVPPTGVLTKAQPDDSAQAAALAGDAAIANMGAADLGQACIVNAGEVLATETDAGTDALINGSSGPGWLYKAPKPGQDRRADLPTIGPDTARAAARAGLNGLIIEAGGVMVLDLPTVINILDTHGMVLWVRERAA